MLGEAHLRRGEKGAPRFSLEEVAGCAREWLVLSGCRKGAMTRALMDRVLGRPRELERLSAPSSTTSRSRSGTRRARRRRAQRRPGRTRRSHDVLLVATNNVHYATPTPSRAPTCSRLARARAGRDGGWLNATARAPAQRFRAAPTLRALARVVDQAGELATALAFDLRLVAPNLPPFSTPPGWTSSPIWKSSWRGATKRYGTREEERVAGAWRQIDHELGSSRPRLRRLLPHGVDITEFCRRNDIYCQGRSAANSRSVSPWASRTPTR